MAVFPTDAILLRFGNTSMRVRACLPTSALYDILADWRD